MKKIQCVTTLPNYRCMITLSLNICVVTVFSRKNKEHQGRMRFDNKERENDSHPWQRGQLEQLFGFEVGHAALTRLNGGRHQLGV